MATLLLVGERRQLTVSGTAHVLLLTHDWQFTFAVVLLVNATLDHRHDLLEEHLRGDLKFQARGVFRLEFDP